MSLPVFHMICGPVGAGKTTYARALSQRLNALPFSIDQWMVALYGPDAPATPSWQWIVERIGRCEAQIAHMAVQAAQRSVSSVLDQSFLRIDDRAKIKRIADDAGIAVQLHCLDAPTEERWQRVSNRNNEKGETFSLEVSRSRFDFVEKFWQAPTPAEMAALNGVRV